MDRRRMQDMLFDRDGNTDKPQDLGEHFASMASRLKLNFRSTRCREQSFPPFIKEVCGRNSLPSELQELILAHLPTLKLLELKAVGRSWRDLLQSSNFKETWRRRRGGRSDDWIGVWVMKSKEGDDLIAYVPEVEKYFLFLSLLCSPVITNSPAFTVDLKDANILCACWPLLVFGKVDWRSAPSFLVYDVHRPGFKVPDLHLQEVGGRNATILSSSFLELIMDFPPIFRGLAVEVQSIRDDGSSPLNQLLVWKAGMHEWELYPRSSATQADFSDMSAIQNGLLFRYDQEDNTLYAWSTRHWSKAVVVFSQSPHDMPNGDLSSIQNAKVNAFKVVRTKTGLLLLTSMVQQQEGGGVTQCFTVWKLMKEAEEAVTWNWFEISRIPEELCLKGFSRESFLHPTAICDGSRICILSSTNEFSPALVYDVLKGSWYHLHGVFRDMQAVFATRVQLTIDGLEKSSDPSTRQYDIVREMSRRYPWRGL